MDTRLIAEEKCHSQCWLCPLERFDLELLGIFKPNPSDRNSGEGGVARLLLELAITEGV